MIIAFTGAGISKASGIETFLERPDIRAHLHRQFATENPETYRQTMRTLWHTVANAQPNKAHTILAEHKVPVITMNIDSLHEKAGSASVIAVHGTMPLESELDYADELFNKPVLYGDMAPNYQKAINKVNALGDGDTLLVIGASRFTQIAVQLREIAYHNGARIIEIQENAETETEKILLHLLKQEKERETYV